jgi:hypothetical protein
VLRWAVAALNTIEVPVLSLWFVNISGGKDSNPSEALRGWAEMRLQQLDGWLEETLFRGYMQPAVQARIGRWLGLATVAVVFAAYHGRFTPAMFLGKLGVGLVLGGLRDRTRTLWAPAVAHVLQWTVLAMT